MIDSILLYSEQESLPAWTKFPEYNHLSRKKTNNGGNKLIKKDRKKTSVYVNLGMIFWVVILLRIINSEDLALHADLLNVCMLKDGV